MSTNQERRVEARKRLREQMETQARREKQLKIGAASVVAVVLLGIVGIVVWNNAEQARAEEYAANWADCVYPEDTAGSPEKVDPAEFEDEGPEVMAEVRRFNEQVDQVEESKREVEPPSGDQPRRGTAEVTITTGQGEIPLTLDREGAACNVESFLHLAQEQFFDDTECHRLTIGAEGSELSVLQCGDPTGTGMSGPGYTVADEPPTGLEQDAETGMSIYPRGTVAMAKSQAPDSAGSQFFLVYEDSYLPPDYTVMGTIGESGLDVLDEIAETGIKSDDPSDADYETPQRPVEIETVMVGAQEGLPED